jgi:fructose-bisphosphate aldolase, class II
MSKKLLKKINIACILLLKKKIGGLNMLVNSKDLLLKAKKYGYAIPATDVFNLELIKGVLEASTEKDLPLIVALAEVHTDTLSIADCAHIVKYYAEKMNQQIVLHLDHGYSLEKIKEAVDCGFTSVMVDGSSLSYEENVEKTRKVVEYAHKHNITVEAEIGHVGSNESVTKGDDSMYTTVDEAVKFTNDTNIDSLAVSIGTAHGVYKGVPKLNFERLSEISKAISVPLVLHGGSGTGYDNLNRAVSLGISKVNIYTDLINAATDACKDTFSDISYFDACKIAQNAVKDKLEEYYDVFMTKK